MFAFAEVPLNDKDYNALPQMSSEFLGEPKNIKQMRVGDGYWVPAHALSVDKHAKCWLDPECKLNEKSDHVIYVIKFKKTTEHKAIIGYAVTIDKKKLQSWRWKLIKVDKNKLIPVRALSIY